MARKIMGTRAFEAVCPLCDTDFIMTSDEVHFIDMDNKDPMAYFWCDVCERNVKVDPQKDREIAPIYVARDFFD